MKWGDKADGWSFLGAKQHGSAVSVGYRDSHSNILTPKYSVDTRWLSFKKPH